MDEWFSVQATVRREGGRVVLSGEPGQGTVSFDEADVRETAGGLELRIGASVTILEMPPRRVPTEEEVATIRTASCPDPYRTICFMFGSSAGSLICCSTNQFIGTCYNRWSNC